MRSSKQFFEMFARETYASVAKLCGFPPEFGDDFATTIESILAEIEAADPSDLRELEPGEDWDDGACTEPPEEDGDYFEEDDGL